MYLLFSHGTLQLEKVQIETYERLLTGLKDSSKGYTLRGLKTILITLFLTEW